MQVHATHGMKATAKAKEETPMNSVATPTVNPSTQDPKEQQHRQTAKDIITANVKSLIEQLEAGHSDVVTAYLDAMSRFHNYSLGNILEIARQRPSASSVAGMHAWNQLGRRVKKGEKGIRILAPIIGSKRKPDEKAEKDITRQTARVLAGFRNVYVFDVEQTEGVDLPAMPAVYGDVGENYDRLLSLIDRQGVELVFTEDIAPALGISYGGRIAILPGQSKAETFATLVHELVHEMLHKSERRASTTKAMRETEAEAIAFVVGKAVGLDAGTASADYIHLCHGNASLLADSLEVIQQTSAVIIAALESSVAAETIPNTERAKIA
jgi:antirestriction protein ArdC